jgi:hypothetical protein
MENLLALLKMRYAAARQAKCVAQVALDVAGLTPDVAGSLQTAAGAAGLPQVAVGAAGLLWAAAGVEELPLTAAGAEELSLTAAGAEEPSLAGLPQVTAGAAMSPSPATGSWEAATSPVDDQPEEPSDIKLELPPPRKLKIFDGGWSSDDIKTFDKDRGREGNTHTHTHCSLLGKVVSFLL